MKGSIKVFIVVLILLALPIYPKFPVQVADPVGVEDSRIKVNINTDELEVILHTIRGKKFDFLYSRLKNRNTRPLIGIYDISGKSTDEKLSQLDNSIKDSEIIAITGSKGYRESYYFNRDGASLKFITSRDIMI